MKHARFVLLIVLAVCLVLTADLLWNVTMALAADGAPVCTGLFSRLVFGNVATLSDFAVGFLIAVAATLAQLAVGGASAVGSVVDAVVAGLAVCGIDDAVAATRGEIGAVEAASII